MTSHKIPGDELATHYAAGPVISVAPVGEDLPSLTMEFISSTASGDRKHRLTTARFGMVIQYLWNQFEFWTPLENKQDFEFHLIEITDSELIERIASTGKFATRPAGQRLGASLDEREVHHYRIGFDDHGVYDIVCASLDIEYAYTDDLSRLPTE